MSVLKMFFALLAAILTAVILLHTGALLVRLEKRREQNRIAEWSRGLEIVRMLSAACVVYKNLYDRHPPSLEALGPGQGDCRPSPRCAGLIDAQTASGRALGHRIEYKLKPTKAGSRNHSLAGYEVFVTRDGPAVPGLYNYYLDESGIIRSTTEPRRAGPNDPVIM